MRGELRTPALQSLIELLRIDAQEHIADDREARYQVLTAHASAAKAGAGALGEVFGPLGHVLVAARPAQRRARGDRQHHVQRMAPALAAARIGDGTEEIRQRLHLGGGEHQFWHSTSVRGLEMGLTQKRTRMARQRAQEDFLRRCGGVGVSALAASIPTRVPDIRPIGGQIERAAMALRIDKGLKQHDRMTERLEPIPCEAALAQRQRARGDVRTVPPAALGKMNPGVLGKISPPW